LIPGKTRIFSISPVDYTIQFRQYFLDFLVSMQNARLECEHAIGINKDSLEWTQLVKILLDLSQCIVTGDYSKFGPTLMHKVVAGCFDIIFDWYKKFGDLDADNDLCRRSLAEECMHSKHLMLDLIYRVFCGAPSGSPITTILNTMVNSVYIRCVWAYMCDPANDLMPKIDGRQLGMVDFRKSVRLVTYGDDLIMSVLSSIVKYFNATTIGSVFKKYEIVFTDSSKGSEIMPYAEITDFKTTFLKSNFVRHPSRYGVWIHQLDRRAVQEVSNWIMHSRTPKEMSIQVCSASLMSMWGYGRIEYDSLREKILEYWGARGEFISLPTWEEEEYRMFGDGEEVAPYKLIEVLRKLPLKN